MSARDRRASSDKELVSKVFIGDPEIELPREDRLDGLGEIARALDDGTDALACAELKALRAEFSAISGALIILKKQNLSLGEEGVKDGAAEIGEHEIGLGKEGDKIVMLAVEANAFRLEALTPRALFDRRIMVELEDEPVIS